ncbi:MAG: hypothetical protein WCD42_05920 [Rhizomicrobium sp.]
MVKPSPLWILATVALLTTTPLAAQEKGQFNGFLYEVLDAIGTEDEGPIYFLQQFNGTDLPILKKAAKDREDDTLQGLIGKKVTIEGNMLGQSIEYKRIGPYAATKP